LRSSSAAAAPGPSSALAWRPPRRANSGSRSSADRCRRSADRPQPVIEGDRHRRGPGSAHKGGPRRHALAIPLPRLVAEGRLPRASSALLQALDTALRHDGPL